MVCSSSRTAARAGASQACYGPTVLQLIGLHPPLGDHIVKAGKDMDRLLGVALTLQQSRALPAPTNTDSQQQNFTHAPMPGPAQSNSASEAAPNPVAGQGAHTAWIFRPSRPFTTAPRTSHPPPPARPPRSSRRAHHLAHCDVSCPTDAEVYADIYGGRRLHNVRVQAWLAAQPGISNKTVQAMSAVQARELMRTMSCAAGVLLPYNFIFMFSTQ